MKGNDLYHEWLDAGRMNPFVQPRIRDGLTQAEIAKLTGLSEQYVRRQEQGLINTPSGAISELLGVPAANYYAWRDKMRGLVSPALVRASIIPALPGYWDNKHPFEFVMYSSVVVTQNYFGLPLADSKNLFGRYLVMHPRNWQLYVNSQRAEMPGELANALTQVGINPSEIEKVVAKWISENS